MELLPTSLEADKIRFEIWGRSLPVKPINLLTVVAVALALIASGCGTSDYVQSVTLSTAGASAGASVFNLSGQDGTLQLVATANYHSGKQVDVTNSVTYTVTPIGTDQSGNVLPAYGAATVPINTTGLMTAVVSLCTWEDVGNPIPTPPQYNWVYTGYYQTIAIYKGMQSQPVAIGVGSAASTTAPNGVCGPS
jgi:hypothetical protein